MKLSRARHLEFVRADGSKLVVPPLTWGQWRELLALDPPDDAPESQFKMLERVIKRLEVQLRHAVCTDAAGTPQSVSKAIDALAPHEAHEITAALVAGLYGELPPETAAELHTAVQGLIKKKLIPRSAKTSQPNTTGRLWNSPEFSASRRGWWTRSLGRIACFFSTIITKIKPAR